MKLTRNPFKPYWKTVGELKFLITQPNEDQEMRLQEIQIDSSIDTAVKNLKYARLYMKFVIKGWEGIDEECVIVDNELEDSLWKIFVLDVAKLTTLWSIIYKDLKFTENDKKKS